VRLSAGRAARRSDLAASRVAAMRMRTAERGVSVVIGVPRSVLSGIAKPARTLSALPSGLLRSAPPAVRFKTKPEAAGARRSQQGPAAACAGL